MQGNDNFVGKSPETGLGQSPYRIAAEQYRDADPVEPEEPVITVTTRIRYLMEDFYDRVGDAGTTVWKHTPMGAMQGVFGEAARLMSGGRYIYDAHPPKRADVRRETRRMEQVGAERHIEELKNDFGIDK